MSAPVVIVGAGEAGARAAGALRENGFAGEVVLLGAEPHAPYERPPLSKRLITEPGEPAAPFIGAENHFADAGIEFRPDAPVLAIDRAAKAVVLASGERVPFGRLLLATGASARQLALPGASAQNVLYLRTFSDALRLRARLGAGGHLIVVGGGFIGLEIAAGARERGVAVTLLEMAPRLLTRGVPAELAEAIASRHRENGVDLRFGVRLEGIENTNGRHAVLLEGGERIEADGIVAGIGAAPETALAKDAGLGVDNGVAVDATLRTNDPAIWAAGDCCSFPHPLYNNRRIRLEAWRNAQDQGACAARNLLGAGEPYAAVPWFWSDQFEATLQIAGLPDEGAAVVARDLGNAVLRFHLASDGRLVAASGFGPNGTIARDIRLAEMLIARCARPDPAALADPGVRLKGLLAA